MIVCHPGDEAPPIKVTRGARESGEKCGGPRLLPVLLGSPWDYLSGCDVARSPRIQSPAHEVVIQGAKESKKKCGGPRLLPLLFGSLSMECLRLPQDESWIYSFLGLPE